MACPPRRSKPEPKSLQEKITRLLAEASDGIIAVTLGPKK